MPRDMRCISKTEKGYWVRVNAPGGKRPERTFRSYEQAKSWRDLQESSFRDNRFTLDERITLREWAAIAPSLRRDVRVSTSLKKETLYRVHVDPHFGDWLLDNIRYVDICRWIDDLKQARHSRNKLNPQGKPYAPETIHQIWHQLHQLLMEAKRAGRLQEMPLSPTNLPLPKNEERRFLTIEECRRIEACLPEVYRLMFALMIDTGLRIGEVCALRWRNIDLTSGSVKPTSTVAQGPNGIRIENDTKTAKSKNRVIPTLRPSTVERLTAVQDEANAYVFTTPLGHPLSPHNFRQRVWIPAIRKAELPEPQPTPHSTRHSAIALWAEAGYTLLEAQEFLGHRDLKMIAQIYGHVQRNKDYSTQRDRLQAQWDDPVPDAPPTSPKVTDLSSRRRGA